MSLNEVHKPHPKLILSKPENRNPISKPLWLKHTSYKTIFLPDKNDEIPTISGYKASRASLSKICQKSVYLNISIVGRVALLATADCECIQEIKSAVSTLCVFGLTGEGGSQT